MSSSQVAQLEPKSAYAAHFVTVFGSKMHYLDESKENGREGVVLFLHGMPSSSYLWRNIIPFFSPLTRCVAPDLIGMGRSDQPDIDYNVMNHLLYLTEFIKQLNLKNITLVMQGWACVLGLAFAEAHPELIKGLVMIEGHFQVEKELEASLPLAELRKIMSNKEEAFKLIMNDNYLIEQWFPLSIGRKLSDYEMAYYREPFKYPAARKVLWQYLQDLLSMNESGAPVLKIIDAYKSYLRLTSAPKLMVYGLPGFITPMSTVEWAKATMPNLQLACIENSLHYPMESQPKRVGHILKEWYLLAEKEQTN